MKDLNQLILCCAIVGIGIIRVPAFASSKKPPTNLKATCSQLATPLTQTSHSGGHNHSGLNFSIKLNAALAGHPSSTELHPDGWVPEVLATVESALESLPNKKRKAFVKKLKTLRQLDLEEFHFESAEQKTILRHFYEARFKMQEIQQFLQAREPQKDSAYLSEIFEAVLSLYTSHLNLFLTDRHHDELDLARYQEILRQLKAFDLHDNPTFGLYRIQRAIKGRYSLTEFIKCI